MAPPLPRAKAEPIEDVEAAVEMLRGKTDAVTMLVAAIRDEIASLKDFNRELGVLRDAKIAEIKQAVSVDIPARLDRFEEHAERTHSRLHERVDVLDKEVADLNVRVTHVEHAATHMVRHIDETKDDHARLTQTRIRWQFVAWIAAGLATIGGTIGGIFPIVELLWQR